MDRSSGKYGLVNGLRALGLKVERHDDHFAQTTPDVEWLAKCKENNWIIISSDKRIKKNHIERKVIINSGNGAFFFTSNEITTEKQLEIVKTALRRIAGFLQSRKRPFIARLTSEGKVELWIDHKGDDVLQKKALKKSRNQKM